MLNEITLRRHTNISHIQKTTVSEKAGDGSSGLPKHLGAQGKNAFRRHSRMIPLANFLAAEWPKCFHYFDPSISKNEGFEEQLIYCHILDKK